MDASVESQVIRQVAGYLERRGGRYIAPATTALKDRGAMCGVIEKTIRDITGLRYTKADKEQVRVLRIALLRDIFGVHLLTTDTMTVGQVKAVLHHGLSEEFVKRWLDNHRYLLRVNPEKAVQLTLFQEAA